MTISLLTFVVLILFYIRPIIPLSCTDYSTQNACILDSRCSWDSSSNTPCICADALDQDLMFVMDGSGSVGNNGWIDEKQFVIETIETGISDDTRVAIIQFSNSIWIEWRFYNSQNTNTIVNHVNGMNRQASITRTKSALETAVDLFESDGGSNPYVLLLITDGNPVPFDTEHPCPSTNNRQVYDDMEINGIYMVIVGVGDNWSPNTLNLCVDDPGTQILEVSSFDALSTLRGAISQITCPSNVDFEITEMRFNSGGNGGTAEFIELFNTGDTLIFDGSATQLKFGSSGSVRGDFVGVNGQQWTTETFMVLYKNGGTALNCRNCTCSSSYGYSFSGIKDQGTNNECNGPSACCSDQLYVEAGDGSANSAGAYFWTGATNTNFAITIQDSTSTTIVSTSYTSSFPSIIDGWTYEKTALLSSESDGSNWAQSCWSYGTPGDDAILCTRTCLHTDCTVGGDNGGFLQTESSTECTCTSGENGYYPNGCSCNQIQPPSNCISYVNDGTDNNGNPTGDFTIISTWTASSTPDVTYTFDYSADGVVGQNSGSDGTSQSKSGVIVVGDWSASVFAVLASDSSVYSSSISCSVVTPAPSRADTPSPVESTPSMTCSVTVLSSTIVIFAWADSNPPKSDYRIYAEYQGSSSSSETEAEDGDNNCVASEISAYVEPYASGGNCKKILYPETIDDTSKVEAYMSPYIYSGLGELQDAIMESDRVMCTVYTLDPTKAPTDNPKGAPTESPAVEPSHDPTAAPTISFYDVITCTVEITAGTTNDATIFYTYTLANGHDTTLGFGSAVSLQWKLRFTDPATALEWDNTIDFNSPEDSISLTFTGGYDYGSVNDYQMYAFHKPFPGASTTRTGNLIDCNVVSSSPSDSPTTKPTGNPSITPTRFPSGIPSSTPSNNPTPAPTYSPVEISNCVVSLDDEPTTHVQFTISFDNPTWNPPDTPDFGDVYYYMRWCDPNNCVGTEQDYDSLTGRSASSVSLPVIPGNLIINNGYDFEVTIQWSSDDSTAGSAVACTILTQSPTPDGYIAPTASPAYSTPQVYFDLSSNRKQKYCTEKSEDDCILGDCIPTCQVAEKSSAEVFDVIREHSEFNLVITYNWRIYCCDVEEDGCLDTTDSCDVSRRRRLQEDDTPSPTVTGYLPPADADDFQEIASSGTFEAYPQNDGTDSFDVLILKNDDVANPEYAWLVLEDCSVTPDPSVSPYAYNCTIPQNNLNKPSTIKLQIQDNGTGAFTSKKEGDLPTWIWGPIAGGIVLLALLSWLGYRYYQKRKYNEELLEQRKHEMDQLPDDNVGNFGGVGENVNFNPLSTGGTVQIATSGDFVDKQLNVQKQNFEVAQVDVDTEVFRQDFGPVKAQRHDF